MRHIRVILQLKAEVLRMAAFCISAILKNNLHPPAAVEKPAQVKPVSLHTCSHPKLLGEPAFLGCGPGFTFLAVPGSLDGVTVSQAQPWWACGTRAQEFLWVAYSLFDKWEVKTCSFLMS